MQKQPADTSTKSRWSAKKIGVFLLKLILGALAFYLIWRKVDIQKVGVYLQQANALYLVLAAAFFFLSKAVAAIRLNYYYASQGLNLSSGQGIRLNLLAMFYSLFIPLVGGDGYRVIWLKNRYGTPVKSLIWSSVLDRVSGVAALVALAALIFPATTFKGWFQWLGLLGIPVMYLVYYFVHRQFWRSYLPVWKSVNVAALIVQFLQVVCVVFILLALNVSDHQLDYLFIFLLASLAYMLPFMGAREMAFLLGAEYLGLDLELSLAISVLFYLALAGTSLTGISFLLFPSRLEVDEPVSTGTA
ncbi:flippase-like domain-containing protein [bacterium SCSIO 12741]|nr:flippase-like domain-containing protein [bacterium SCSIO 12741]